MSNVLLYIDGIDRTEYFKGPLSVNPGGDGQVGSATIYLSQQAGGLDLRPMMDVRVYVPHNTTTNAGVASKGRLFGGVVAKRGTTNIGTEKIWTLPCWDYNIILKKSYRRAQPVHAVNLTAADLDDQITELFEILQGPSPTVQIDTSGTALTTPMPAVIYPGGHTWEWYLQQLLATAHAEDDAVFPAYYMGVSETSGGSDVFGNPKLWVYDNASPPVSVVAFSDTPTGDEKDVYELFTRDTDATAIAQIAQSWWAGRTLTATAASSISTYPNPYDDHTSAWADGDVIEDTQSTTLAEAQAVVDNVVLAKGFPRDSFKWVTYDRVMPGEYIDLNKWDLEGISEEQYRVAAATFEWEEPNVIRTTLTLNSRRLGLFEDGSGYFAPPIEGDNVPPLPAADFTLTTDIYNFNTGVAELTFAIDDTGASPDTAGYNIAGVVNGLLFNQDVGTDLSPTLYLPSHVAYALRVRAYDNSGNYSETFPAPDDTALTGVTAGPPYHILPPNLDYEIKDNIDPTLPAFWSRSVSGNATAAIDDTVHANGLQSVKLVHGTGGGGQTASITSERFIVSAGVGEVYEYAVHAKGNAGAEVLEIGVTLFDESGTPVLTEIKEFYVSDVWRLFPVQIRINTQFVRFASINIVGADAVASAKTIWVDAGSWHPVGSETKAGFMSVSKNNALDAVSRTDISLIDRARMARGWRNLGALTGDAFREACIVYHEGNYHVFSTQEWEVDKTRVHIASTPEGIVSATPTDDLAPVKYPAVFYDDADGLWHLYGSTSGITKHYTAPAPDGPYTYSEDVDTADDIFDAFFAKHPTNGKYYGIGFENEPPTASTPLQLIWADSPYGPWTSLGNVFADVGFPPFAKNGRPDPGLAFVGGRDYIFFSGRPNTQLGAGYYPSICEINLETGRVINAPYALVDEREAWMVGDQDIEDYGISDLQFLRVPNEPDRIFAWSNDGGNTADWSWGVLELDRVVVPTDGRRHDDLFRFDPSTGVDKATGIRAVVRSDTTLTADGVQIDVADGGVMGFLSQQYINEVTMFAEFTVDGTQGDPAIVACIMGADYTVGPTVAIDIESGDIRGVIQSSDDLATVIPTGINALDGERYAVVLMRDATGLTRMWVNGVLAGTPDDTATLITDAEVFSIGAQQTLTQAVRYPFVGTVHKAWAVASALPLSEVKRYPGVNSAGGGGGSGTVTSVAMTVPTDILSVSGTPITTTGTLAVSKANQSANTVFAGPTSGGAAAPAFRALVVADIPAKSGYGAFSSIPAAGNAGRLYTPSDGYTQWVDDGTVWRPVVQGVVGKAPPAAATFSYLNQGSSTKADSGGATVFTLPVTVAADAVRGMTIAVPSAPYTLTVAFHYFPSTTDFFNVGFVFHDGTKCLTMGLAGAGSSSNNSITYLRAMKWTNTTTYAGSSYFHTIWPALNWGGPHWMRVNDNNTNRIFYYSSDGRNWVQIHSVSRTDYLTPTTVGIGGWAGVVSGSPVAIPISLLSWEV